MGIALSHVKDNAREVILSSDENRNAVLLSREVQDELAARSADPAGIPVSSVNAPVTAAPGGAFSLTWAANRGWFYAPAFPGLGADDSAFLPLRWGSTTLAHATPDGSNPRVDLLVGAPTMVDADLQSRSILTDPVSRSITPQNVFKTSNPVTGLSVVTGTPASAPVPPAVPANTVAIAEVFVPAGAADSTTFVVAPRLWRSMLSPGGVMHGPATDMQLGWTDSDPTTTSSTLALYSDAVPHRVWVDGEMVEFFGSPKVFQDAGSANPFAVAAAAGASKPYYVYLCAGRHLPQGAVGTAVGSPRYVPAVLVESLTAPDSQGFPSANLATPRGVTQFGAVYVGLGFVFRNTTNRQPCAMTSDVVYGKLNLEEQTGITGASGTVTLASAPSDLFIAPLEVVAAFSVTGAAGGGVFDVNPGDFGVPASGGPLASHGRGMATLSVLDTVSGVTAMMRLPLSAARTLAFTNSWTTPGLMVLVKGYTHRVRRIGRWL